MDEALLDQLLQQGREKRSAGLPGAFSQNVWREIRLRRSQSEETAGRIELWGWLLRPQMVVAALALAITVGISVGRQQYMSSAAQTHAALDLQVFGESSAALPSTLLASTL